MSYIRRKQVKGATYYQVVHGYRDLDGTVRQSTIASLGRHPTIQEALADTERQLRAAKRRHKQELELWPRTTERPSGSQRRVVKLSNEISVLLERRLRLREAAVELNIELD